MFRQVIRYSVFGNSSCEDTNNYYCAVNHRLKSVVREIRHATFCGNRGRVTASGDPVGVETGLRQGY